MESIWQNTSQSVEFQMQSKDIKTDVLIIGGGLCGILCAYKLQQAGVSYVLAEADRIMGGISENTTAKITFQHGLIYDRLINTFGLKAARLYLKANMQALEEYRKMCEIIDCDFADQDAFVYSMIDRRKITAEVAAYNKLGVNAKFVGEIPLPFRCAGAVKVEGQAMFNPLKFAYSVAKGLNIFENTKVLELKPKEVITNRGRIFAKNIIVATHFPFLNKHGSYFLKLYQHRSYVIALKNAPEIDGMYVDEDKKGLSFRRYGEYLLLGGGSHRTGKKGGNWRELEAYAKKHYPDAREVARWATQDCMSLDSVPYIGRYSKRTPNLFVATGFNKWGMTSSMVAANILADLVQGKKNKYAALFSPSRSMLHPQLLINAAESTIGLLTPTAPRCPHLGCALKYNPQEHSWDCPCHGSRFEKDGKLINNPATDDKSF